MSNSRRWESLRLLIWLKFSSTLQSVDLGTAAVCHIYLWLCYKTMLTSRGYVLKSTQMALDFRVNESRQRTSQWPPNRENHRVWIYWWRCAGWTLRHELGTCLSRLGGTKFREWAIPCLKRNRLIKRLKNANVGSNAPFNQLWKVYTVLLCNL